MINIVINNKVIKTPFVYDVYDEKMYCEFHVDFDLMDITNEHAD